MSSIDNRSPLSEITNNHLQSTSLNSKSKLNTLSTLNVDHHHHDFSKNKQTLVKNTTSTGLQTQSLSSRSPNSSTPLTLKRTMISNISDDVEFYSDSENDHNRTLHQDDLNMTDSDITHSQIRFNKSLYQSTNNNINSAIKLNHNQSNNYSHIHQMNHLNISMSSLNEEPLRRLEALSDIKSRVNVLGRLAKEMTDQLQSQNNNNNIQKTTIDEEFLKKSNEEREYLKKELDIKQETIDNLLLETSNQKSIIDKLILELELYKNENLKLQENESQNQIKFQEEIKKLNLQLVEKDRNIDSLEKQNREGEMMRRSLHNTIQELKGNIRVFCRLRPVSSPNEDVCETTISNDKSITFKVNAQSVTGQNSIKSTSFEFDKIFGIKSTQAMIFEELSQLVQSSLDGYSTCIFAYGQTGSGKTHTMEGEPGGENRGMIPRTVELIFNQAEELSNKGWQFQFEASFLEIYNENINDLLASTSNNSSKVYEIRHDGVNTMVTNLTYVSVGQPDDVYTLLNLASKNRAVAKTFCNDRSSRSHSVFQLKLIGFNIYTNEKTVGLLNLIDLAGSERISKSGVTGDRLKETQSINKSLSCLSDVISALANKEKHIPFRNSKLTYLLQNSLGGNSKTLMFVNISSDAKDFQETISSLRFATKVNSCEIGRATKQSKIE